MTTDHVTLIPLSQTIRFDYVLPLKSSDTGMLSLMDTFTEACYRAGVLAGTIAGTAGVTGLLGTRLHGANVVVFVDVRWTMDTFPGEAELLALCRTLGIDAVVAP